MVRVKICGITDVHDAVAACEAGADALGLNFYENSPRVVARGAAGKIRAIMPEQVHAVGVFVNASVAEISELCATLKLDFAQMHGDEFPHTVAEVSASVPVIKAFRVRPDFALSTLNEFSGVFAFLLDGAREGQYGGTGLTLDWPMAKRAAAMHRIILAGGLTVENVGAAIRLVHPYAVDVASGVESKPGKKDHGRLREFIAEVRRAEELLKAEPQKVLGS